MSAENEEPKKPAESESIADSVEEAEVIRTPIVPERITDASGKPDDPRSPGEDRDAIAPQQPTQEIEVVRRLVVPDVTDASGKPDDSRSPGEDRDAIAPQQPTQEGEVVRKLVVPDVTDAAGKPDDPRSPGEDRDAIVEGSTASTTEETETVRRLIVPDEVESENSSSLTNEQKE